MCCELSSCLEWPQKSFSTLTKKKKEKKKPNGIEIQLKCTYLRMVSYKTGFNQYKSTISNELMASEIATAQQAIPVLCRLVPNNLNNSLSISYQCDLIHSHYSLTPINHNRLAQWLASLLVTNTARVQVPSRSKTFFFS